MSLVELKIKGISYSQTQNGAYALVLNEIGGKRKLLVVIGVFEAQSIAIALDKEIVTTQPLTHDLFKNLADQFYITIKKIIIHKLVDGIFYSSIVCEKDKIEEIINARTSDAIAMALRFNAPIFACKNILDEAGIYLKIDSMKSDTETENLLTNMESFETEDGKQKNSKYARYNVRELYKLLEKTVLDEDYEKAVQIRDEISRRETK